jgi:2'-5' RNA ligase
VTAELRLFMALDLPPAVRSSLEEVQRELKRTGADVRWVRIPSIHLTIKFLGQVEAGKVEEIRQAVEPAVQACPALSLHPAGTGVFPGSRNPRVVWVGLRGDLERLGALAGEVDQALTGLGFQAEKRPFKPHLTLGRVKSGRNKAGLMEGVLSLAGFKGPEFQARELILFRSELKPSGAIYTALARIPFNPGG